MHTYIHTQIYTHTYAPTHKCTHTCRYTHTHTHTHTHIYIYIYTPTYTYTYTHWVHPIKRILHYNNSYFTKKKYLIFQYNLYSLKLFFLLKNKLLYFFSVEIFRLGFLSFVHGALHFIIARKIYSTQKLFQAAKQREIIGGQVWTVKRAWQLFSMKMTDGFPRSYCRMRPSIVLEKPNDNWP